MTQEISESPLSDSDTALSPTRYATFSHRFRAFLTDSVLVVLGVMLAIIAADATGRVSGSGVVALLVMFSLIVLYEPLLVWRRGATIGHSLNHIVVVADRTGRHPGFVRAFARYLIKLVLGIPSFVAMMLSRRRQSVHDWLTGTTVQLAAGTDPDVVDFYLARDNEADTLLPSRLRRTVVALGYLILLFVINDLVLLAIDPERCVLHGNCNDGMHMILDVVTIIWLSASVASVVAVRNGLMLGARRRKESRSDVPLA